VPSWHCHVGIPHERRQKNQQSIKPQSENCVPLLLSRRALRLVLALLSPLTTLTYCTVLWTTQAPSSRAFTDETLHHKL